MSLSPGDNYVRETVNPMSDREAGWCHTAVEDLKPLGSEGERATSLSGQEKWQKPQVPARASFSPKARVTQSLYYGKSMQVEVEGLGVGPGFAGLLV